MGSCKRIFVRIWELLGSIELRIVESLLRFVLDILFRMTLLNIEINEKGCINRGVSNSGVFRTRRKGDRTVKGYVNNKKQFYNIFEFRVRGKTGNSDPRKGAQTYDGDIYVKIPKQEKQK